MRIATIVKNVVRRTKAGLIMMPLSLLCTALLAQNTVTVKGHIVDEKNVPVAGASVIVRNARHGVTADANGNFSISVPPQSTLVISHVGFAPKQLKAWTGEIDIILQPSNDDMDQVVVIGYGTQQRKDVTGSVATVSGAKINEVPAVDISRALQGRIAGVQMSQTSSKPGAGMQIRIRGTRSLNATNDP